MRIIKCDRCGADIPSEHYDNVGSVGVWWRGIYEGSAGPNPFNGWDLCDKCMEEVECFIRTPDAWISREDHEVLMTKLATREKKYQEILDSVDAGKKNGKRWDVGKAQALRDAGWTLEEIAKEVGVTMKTIYANTTPRKARKKYPNEWAEHEPDLSPETRKAMGEKHIEVANEEKETPVSE